jgi:hypothetical protein
LHCAPILRKSLFAEYTDGSWTSVLRKPAEKITLLSRAKVMQPSRAQYVVYIGSHLIFAHVGEEDLNGRIFALTVSYKLRADIATNG